MFPCKDTAELFRAIEKALPDAVIACSHQGHFSCVTARRPKQLLCVMIHNGHFLNAHVWGRGESRKLSFERIHLGIKEALSDFQSRES